MTITAVEALLHLNVWRETEVMALYVSQSSRFHLSGFGHVQPAAES